MTIGWGRGETSPPVRDRQGAGDARCQGQAGGIAQGDRRAAAEDHVAGAGAGRDARAARRHRQRPRGQGGGACGIDGAARRVAHETRAAAGDRQGARGQGGRAAGVDGPARREASQACAAAGGAQGAAEGNGAAGGDRAASDRQTGQAGGEGDAGNRLRGPHAGGGAVAGDVDKRARRDGDCRSAGSRGDAEDKGARGAVVDHPLAANPRGDDVVDVGRQNAADGERQGSILRRRQSLIARQGGDIQRCRATKSNINLTERGINRRAPPRITESRFANSFVRCV